MKRGKGWGERGKKEVKRCEVWREERDEPVERRKGKGGRRGRKGKQRGACAQTVLRVAMVQAQSELHRGFAAQLANYHRLQC